jgi:hypothetical protein
MSMGTGAVCVMRSFMINNRGHTLSGDQIKRNEIGAACSTYGGEKNVAHRYFGGET